MLTPEPYLGLRERLKIRCRQPPALGQFEDALDPTVIRKPMTVEDAVAFLDEQASLPMVPESMDVDKKEQEDNLDQMLELTPRSTSGNYKDMPCLVDDMDEVTLLVTQEEEDRQLQGSPERERREVPDREAMAASCARPGLRARRDAAPPVLNKMESRHSRSD